MVALAAAVKHIFGQKFATRVVSKKKEETKVVLGKKNLGLGGGGFTLQFGENMRKEGGGEERRSNSGVGIGNEIFPSHLLLLFFPLEESVEGGGIGRFVFKPLDRVGIRSWTTVLNWPRGFPFPSLGSWRQKMSNDPSSSFLWRRS